MSKDSIKLGKGTIYRRKQKATGKHYGNYLFRYTIKGKDKSERKTVSLNTKNQKEAIKKAENLFPIITAPSQTIVAEHLQLAKGWKRKYRRLPLDQMWEVYSKHTDRARPKTTKILNRYKSYLQEFLDWLEKTYPLIEFMDEIRDIDEYGNKLDTSIVTEYADYLRGTRISVDTHRKKISRPAHIFRTLSKYLDAPSPWENKKLLRSHKEESHITVHRKPFPPEKEKEIFKSLRPDSSLKTLNKAEIEVLCYILKYTGQRLKDCVNLSWNNINMEHRRLSVTQEKTGKKVSIPIANELHEMLLKAATWKINDRVLPKSSERYAIKGKDGTETGGDLINKQILNIIVHVGLTPSVTVPGRKKKITVFGVHSFRHGFASHCAVNGVPKAVVMSILGADSEILDKYYTHVGSEAQEKAINLLSGRPKTTDQDRIATALNLINSTKKKTPLIKKIEALLTGQSPS